MKLLLTGATGFLGTQLLSSLLRRNFQVLITKRASSDLSSIFERFGKLEVWDAEGKLDDIFHNHPNIVAVVHAATDYGRDPLNPTATFWANEVFPMRLLELAIWHGVAIFVNIDTFFNSDKAQYDYLKTYTLSKRHFQEWGRCSDVADKIAFINFRLFHLYGPGDGRQKFIPSIVERCLSNKEIDLTHGEQKRDFIHVNDAISAFNAVLDAELGKGCGYRQYDVGTGTSVRIRDVIESIKRLCRSNVKLNFGALANRMGEFEDACADTTALSTLGWRPKVDMETGLLTVVEGIKQGSAREAFQSGENVG